MTSNAKRDALAEQERIYEPKYGGKDHSGYDTLMKYEVNDEREECFIKGWNARDAEVAELRAQLVSSQMERNHFKTQFEEYEMMHGLEKQAALKAEQERDRYKAALEEISKEGWLLKNQVAERMKKTAITAIIPTTSGESGVK